MAIALQSEFARGVKQAPTSGEAGSVVCQRVTVDLTGGVAASAIVELAILPAHHYITDAILVPEGSYGGATADIGIMSGTPGDNDNTRTSGNEVFDDAALTGVVRGSSANGLLLAPVGADRSIGATFSGALGAGTSRKLTLILFYAQ